jgi:hypothetical protein
MTAVPPTPDRDYPQLLGERGLIEPAPRRVRGYFDKTLVFDTARAHYVWEIAYYPQYYIPTSDVRMDHLRDENHVQKLQFGSSRLYSPGPLPPVSTIPVRSRAACGSNGMRLSGSKRTNHSSFIRATRTCVSTHSAPTATSGSSSTAWYWPRHTAQSCCSKQVCRRAFTSTARTWSSRTWSQARPNPYAPRRESPRRTGHSERATPCIRISLGPTTTRCAKSHPSPG